MHFHICSVITNCIGVTVAQDVQRSVLKDDAMPSVFDLQNQNQKGLVKRGKETVSRHLLKD